MTDDITALRAALAVATPGPWAWMTRTSLWGAETDAIHAGKTCAEVGHSPTECGPAILGVACDALCNDGEDWRPSKANAAYIAACSPDRIARLLDRLEAAERDAARYRWLRENSTDHKLTQKDGYGGRELLGWDELDAAIDAAMQAE